MPRRISEIPFIDRVFALRLRVTTLESPFVSDDLDAWHLETFGRSLWDEMMDRCVSGDAQADAVAGDLLAIGTDAAEAVAAGLRLQGW